MEFSISLDSSRVNCTSKWWPQSREFCLLSWFTILGCLLDLWVYFCPVVANMAVWPAALTVMTTTLGQKRGISTRLPLFIWKENLSQGQLTLCLTPLAAVESHGQPHSNHRHRGLDCSHWFIRSIFRQMLGGSCSPRPSLSKNVNLKICVLLTKSEAHKDGSWKGN